MDLPACVDNAEREMLAMPQMDCPVVHHFGPGVYIREVTLPAGALAIGHAQRFPHLNVMITGKVAMLGDDGRVKILQAPLIFVGQPGRKAGFVLETTVWQNIYATEERDVETLEATFLDKSVSWQEHDALSRAVEHGLRQPDRDDFAKVLEESGFTLEQAIAQSENEADQIPMPDGVGGKLTIRASSIQGRGVFLSSPAVAGEFLAIARLGGKRTPAGRYTNHSPTPNAEFVKLADTIYLVALRDIAGCCGGDHGEEVTVDYRQALALSNIEVKLCLQ